MPDVAGGGTLQIAFESTTGTYTAPTLTVPIENETLAEMRDDPDRKPILGRAVRQGKVKGRGHVEGEIVMEALPTAMTYFLACSRWGNNIAKSGAGPYVYTATDDAAAHVKADDKSLTIAVDRAGIGFAYLGCQVVSSRFFFEDGIFKVAYQVIGREQSEDYTPGAGTDPTETPFAADEVAITIAAAARVDLDSFEMEFDDSGEAKFNLDGQEGASYIKFGEFTGKASFEVDFESKADYAIWVARTVQEVKLVMTKTDIVDIEIHGGLYDSFEVGLSGIGDQVRASAEIGAAYVSGDSAAATIILTHAVDITEITV
jgi:hypothetical protein